VRKVLVLVALTALAVVGVTSASGAVRESGGGVQALRNPLGLTLVRFAKGTSVAQMSRAIEGAGGTVMLTVPQLGVAEAAPGSAGATAFVAAVTKQKGVATAYQEKVVALVDPDAGTATDAGSATGPQLGSPGTDPVPDPWHDAATIFGEVNPEGILQWDDNRMNVRPAWARTLGRGIHVAVIDSGVQGSHKELQANYDNRHSTNTIPCNTLTRTFGPSAAGAFGDCSSEDTYGHGTWVASRIVGAVNGFASNGVAPQATVAGYKALSTNAGGGLTSWIVAALVQACDDGANVVNMSIGGYNDVFSADPATAAADSADYLVWVDAVNYCRAKGVAIFAAAGNEHVRVHRVNVTVGGRALTGVGRVDSGDEGVVSIIPGTHDHGEPLAKYTEDVRGMLEAPAGVPGVIMVAATNNTVMAAQPNNPFGWGPGVVGSKDQLAYYSSYGSRVDLAAPGGARRATIPKYDVGGALDYLRDGFGSLGAIDPSAFLCTTASGILENFACFKVNGAGFAFLQGTSMSSPNAAGVGVLTLAAHPELVGHPDQLLTRLAATARKNMVNHMGPNNPTDFRDGYTGGGCPTGWCHIDKSHPIPFADAYGAGIVNAGAATQ
jgi:subtilisin family serine protease